MQRTSPPFRADHVGSLLRPAALKEARAKRENGEMEPDELKAVEDREIAGVIKKQEDIGLKSITDGEFRRAFWNYDFLGQLDGVEAYLGERKITFQGRQPRPMMLRVIGKLGGYKPHPMIEHFKFVAAHTSATPKMTIPSPSSLHFRYGRDAVPEAIYPDDGRFLPRPGRELPQGGARLRRCRLPLSAARRSQLHLSVRSQAARVVDEPRREPGRAAARLRPHDQCGDLRRAGRHDDHHASVPRQLPVDLRRLGRLRAGRRDPVQRDQDRTAISWNTTASAPAASSRCASCPRARPWCSAWSPRRAARWNPRTSSSGASTRRRSSCPLDQLCLSPQCGFASTEEGNLLTEDEQWAKLRMIVEVAEEVWGALITQREETMTCAPSRHSAPTMSAACCARPR